MCWIRDGTWIANEARSPELAIIISYPKGASGIILLLIIKKADKISRILPDFICKNNRFSACLYNFEQTGTITIFGEHGVIAQIP